MYLHCRKWKSALTFISFHKMKICMFIFFLILILHYSYFAEIMCMYDILHSMLRTAASWISCLLCSPVGSLLLRIYSMLKLCILWALFCSLEQFSVHFWAVSNSVGSILNGCIESCTAMHFYSLWFSQHLVRLTCSPYCIYVSRILIRVAFWILYCIFPQQCLILLSPSWWCPWVLS